MVRDILTAASGAVEDKLYPEDAFVSYVRTGTGADVTVTTNIDMTKGYMVWTKGRSGVTDHAIYDSARGVTKDLASNTTAAQTTQTTGLKSVSTTGHTIGSLAKMNTSGATYVDWVFKKAPKFFDIVTYTGNGVAGRQIPHSLGCEVGMVITKAIATTRGWYTWHRNLAINKFLYLNTTESVLDATHFGEMTSTYFTIGAYDNNAVGETYVAYLFAHDPSADGIIQCGTFTGNVSVSLGWEPQYIMYKRSDSTGNWITLDSMRGIPTGGVDAELYPNLSNAETGSASDYMTLNATGFTTTNLTGTYIYMVIRRPNKVPTSGTEVYNSSDAANGASFPDYISGFAVDLGIQRNGKNISGDLFLSSRLIQGTYLQPYSTAASSNWADMRFDSNVGWSNTSSSATTQNHSWMFKRAKGFFDVVCYTGDGVAGRTVNHNLGVAPELMIVKSRSVAGLNWMVLHGFNGTSFKVNALQTADAASTGIYGGNTVMNADPTSNSFDFNTNLNVNGSATTYVAYLFASLPGISKVGSYTGNGTSQTINCGFSTGARFILSKAVSTTGNWNIGDSTRGITSGTDPLLCLNTTAAEVTTDDWLDPESSGFIVNETASAHANTNGVQYVFLAIA